MYSHLQKPVAPPCWFSPLCRARPPDLTAQDGSLSSVSTRRGLMSLVRHWGMFPDNRLAHCPHFPRQSVSRRSMRPCLVLARPQTFRPDNTPTEGQTTAYCLLASAKWPAHFPDS